MIGPGALDQLTPSQLIRWAEAAARLLDTRAKPLTTADDILKASQQAKPAPINT